MQLDLLPEERFRGPLPPPPGWHAWTAREYMHDWNKGLIADGPGKCDLLPDEQAVIERLHEWRRSDRSNVSRDGVIE